MATKQIEWDDGSGDHILLTYQGQGDGNVIVQSDANDGAARSKTIVIETTAGSPVVSKNLTIRQGACPVPVGTVLDYAYTGSYQEVELPAGQYKLQCWGAQGGSNAAASSYGITAKAGGKGGYSEGVLTITSKTTVRIYVGGAGSSSAGGFNGGGSTSGSSSYSTGTSGQAGYVYGTSRMGGGGGATDIRLSDGALLSRMIVAGGGSGGAMCYNKTITTQTVTTDFWSLGSWVNGSINDNTGQDVSAVTRCRTDYIDISNTNPISLTVDSSHNCSVYYYDSSQTYISPETYDWISGSRTCNPPSNTRYIRIVVRKTNNQNISASEAKNSGSLTRTSSQTVTTTDSDSQVGFAGGGTTGGGYSSSYQGQQNAAGSGGSFGQGTDQTATGYRYCSGAGGGGWYGGGGGQKSDSSMTYCKYSGGGSGFVNTAASAGNRPSGYTGLELDSGTTYAGNTSFPSTSGGTETGHSGNGYARITRIS